MRFIADGGKEGHNWERVDGKKEGLTDRWGFPATARLLIQNFNSPNNNINWNNNSLQPTFKDANGNPVLAYTYLNDDSPSALRYAHLPLYAERLRGYDVKEVVPPLSFTSAEDNQTREIRANLETYRAESQALFITGQMSLDRDWNNYLAQLDRIGLQRFLQVAQTAYNRIK
jgi:putative aldouronate transport system substrate-binding protein